MLREISLLALGFLFVCNGCSHLPIAKDAAKTWDEAKAKRTEDFIRSNPRFAALAEVCSQAGVPPESTLLDKSVLSHGVEIYLSYSSSLSKEDTMNFFRSRLADWRETRAEEFMGHYLYDFERDFYRITVQYGGLRSAAFAVACVNTNASH